MRIKTLLLVVIVTLICWWFLLPSLNLLNIPVRETHGILSHTIVLNRSPSTNIAIYLILLLTPCITILAWEFIRTQGLIKHSGFAFITSKLSQVVQSTIFLPIVCCVLVLAWSINNVGYWSPETSFPLAHDPFHFGEKFGLSASFLESPRTFFSKGYVLIHGFGLNVLPGSIGLSLGGKENDLSWSLFVIHIQSLIPVIFSFLILLEISHFLSKDNAAKIFLLLLLIYFGFYYTAFGFVDRDAIFSIQLFLIIRWLRLLSMRSGSQSDKLFRKWMLLYPILIGALIPISMLYVYDRFVYALVIYIFLLLYLFITESRILFLTYTFVSILALGLTVLSLSLMLGTATFPTAISQIRYWSKVSGLFTSLPYSEIEVSVNELINWLPILLQSITFTILCIQLQVQCFSEGKKLKVFLSENSISIFLFLSTVLYMRIALGRGHLYSPGFFAIFAFATILFQSFAYLEKRFSWGYSLCFFLIFFGLINLSSVAAAANVRTLIKYPAGIFSLLSTKSSDFLGSMLGENYVSIARQIKPDLIDQECFYTLTSHGVWYRFLSLQPCSRYWYFIYSTTGETQQQLIQDLESTKPKIILYSSNFDFLWPDGVSREVSHLAIHQYIWQHYRPYKMIEGHWFWMRRETVLQLSELLVRTTIAPGYFHALSDLPNPDKLNRFNMAASGWAYPSPDASAAERVVLLTYAPLDAPEETTLLGLAQTLEIRPDVAVTLNNYDALVSGWKITFSRLTLPDKTIKFDAWVYNRDDQKFYQLPLVEDLDTEGRFSVSLSSRN
jgi:hypothetical protein